VLNAALLELLTMWPDGTTLVIEYDDDAYVQALAYPPSVLTEIGRLTSSQMLDAVRPYDPPRNIALFLAGSVRAILGRDPGNGYIIHMFNNHLNRTAPVRLQHPGRSPHR